MSVYITQEKIIELLPEVCELAQLAGKKILDIYSTDFEVKYKDDESPLTTADNESHNIIVSGLVRLTPDIPIISEESCSIPFSVRSLWKTYWLIDPLDGTKEFINKNDEFTVNIALIEDGSPVLGVVDVPVYNTTYIAGKGIGCRKIDGEVNSRVNVRKCDKDGEVLVVGSRSHPTEETKSFLEKLKSYKETLVGSSLKFCQIAEGKADLYPRMGLTSEWDTAAAQCVVEQAGGKVVTLDMKPLKYNTKESFINPFFLVFGDKTVDWAAFLK